MRYQDLKLTHAGLATEVSGIHQGNNKLLATIESYKNGDFQTEKDAREEFGMALPGETIYIYK